MKKSFVFTILFLFLSSIAHAGLMQSVVGYPSSKIPKENAVPIGKENGQIDPGWIPEERSYGTYNKSAALITLTVAECSDTLITNYGWNGTASDQTFILCAAAAGLKVRFLNLVTHASADIYWDTPGSSTQFILDGTACGNGNRVWTDNATAYEEIYFYTFTEDGTNYDWAGGALQGVWLGRGS